MESQHLEDALKGINIMELAEKIYSTWPNKYLESTSLIAAELNRLPVSVSHLVKSLVFDLPTGKIPMLGYELQWYLQREAPVTWLQAFLIILAQYSFALFNDPNTPNEPLSLGTIKEQICHNVPLISAYSCSPLSARLSFEPAGGSSKLIYQPFVRICPPRLGFMESLQQVPGRRIALVGAGGGSDGVQAAMLGLLCQKAGKDLVFVASIRASKTTSEDLSGCMGISRSVTKHGGEVASGVFKITRDSTGSGRFVENIPAGDVHMYLVTEDPKPGGLPAQISALIKFHSDAGDKSPRNNVDTVIIVDTGGDVLMDREIGVPAKQQHQDLRVLHELVSPLSTIRTAFPSLKMLSAIVAPGVDCPQDAHWKLETSAARCYMPCKNERDFILETYGRWDFTGSQSGIKMGRYGKTAFAWQAALKALDAVEEAGSLDEMHKLGMDKNRFVTVVLPLPTERVMNKNNPWNPFVPLQAAMAGVLFMEAGDLLETIALGMS